MRDSKDSVKHIHLLERAIPNDANGIARARSATVQERIRTLIIPGSTGRSHEDSGSIEDRSLWIPRAGNLPHLGVGLF